MKKLHPLPSEGRFYCGPGAIAAFTGEHPKGKVREAINKVRDHAPNAGVIGMYNWEVVRVMRMLGQNILNPIDVRDKPMLKDFVKAHPGRAFIAQVTDHYVACSDGWCIDNKSKIPRLAYNFPGNQARVRAVMWVQ